MQYRYIAIEGSIGSGKTTLATMLSDFYNAKLVLEEFADNPFLPKFYNDPEKNAFPLELFFMAERYHQLKKLKAQDLFQPHKISDYFFIKSKLFAQNNLQRDEMQLFNRLFKIMLSSLTKPDIILYLYCNVERLQYNIKKRGRVYEQNINNSYLHNIQKKYLDFFRKQNDFPVIILDVSDVDFVREESVFKKIRDIFLDSYTLGVHNFAL